MSRQRHVYPCFGRAHDTTATGIDCWCKPTRRNLCEQCDGGNSLACSACGGDGLVDAPCDSQPDLVIHNVEKASA